MQIVCVKQKISNSPIVVLDTVVLDGYRQGGGGSCATWISTSKVIEERKLKSISKDVIT